MASGSEVVLRGPAMVGLVRAVAALAQSGLEGYVIVGGVAVAARLGQAHRGTTDVDTVVDEVAHPDAVETLLALPDVQADPTGPHRVRIGGTKVEMIGVGPVDESTFDGLTDMQTLFVAAHTWALSTATALTLLAGSEPTVRATGPFATPAALFAMKLHAIQDRRPTNAMLLRGRCDRQVQTGAGETISHRFSPVRRPPVGLGNEARPLSPVPPGRSMPESQPRVREASSIKTR